MVYEVRFQQNNRLFKIVLALKRSFERYCLALYFNLFYIYAGISDAILNEISLTSQAAENVL